jgi:hypothetical protein
MIRIVLFLCFIFQVVNNVYVKDSFALAITTGDQSFHRAVAQKEKGDAFFRIGNFDSAIEEYTRAVAFYPQFSTGFYNRGLAKLRKKDYKAAIEDFSRAISLKFDYAKAFFNRGKAYAQILKYKEALSDFKEAENYVTFTSQNLIEVLRVEKIVKSCDSFMLEVRERSDYELKSLLESLTVEWFIKPDNPRCIDDGISLRCSEGCDEFKCMGSKFKEIQIRQSVYQAFAEGKFNKDWIVYLILQRFYERFICPLREDLGVDMRNGNIEAKIRSLKWKRLDDLEILCQNLKVLMEDENHPKFVDSLRFELGFLEMLIKTMSQFSIDKISDDLHRNLRFKQGIIANFEELRRQQEQPFDSSFWTPALDELGITNDFYAEHSDGTRSIAFPVITPEAIGDIMFGKESTRIEPVMITETQQSVTIGSEHDIVVHFKIVPWDIENNIPGQSSNFRFRQVREKEFDLLVEEYYFKNCRSTLKYELYKEVELQKIQRVVALKRMPPVFDRVTDLSNITKKNGKAEFDAPAMVEALFKVCKTEEDFYKLIGEIEEYFAVAQTWQKLTFIGPNDDVQTVIDTSKIEEIKSVLDRKKQLFMEMIQGVQEEFRKNNLFSVKEISSDVVDRISAQQCYSRFLKIYS